ncbi:SIR2 family protein [Pseudomonas sp. USHLN015]|uniref:SIR2 family protein n=1 Tax=Pseudomonas sp. USHLN015 TaxID=3081296 RepID=UPI00301DAAF6
MKYRQLEDKETEDFLLNLISSGRNIPFIGTGFTRGEKAKTKKVPDGREWMKIMQAQISASKAEMKPSAERLKTYNFQDLSDIYFGDEIVPLNTIKITLDEHFSGVKISTPSKITFLSLPWPYIYTLNIDDGIENTINGVKVIPYEPFSRGSERKYVYKLHGDVFTALKASNRDDLKLIFGKGDYIKSLTKNRPLIDELKNDIAENNILFIGCSLTDELDILHALAGQEFTSKQSESKRVYITSSEPQDYDTIKRLRDYKITDVIICDYDLFYLKYAELSHRNTPTDSLIESFSFTPTHKALFSEIHFLNYFLQINWKGGDSSHLSIPRTTDGSIIKSATNNPITAITGARFSGKTSSLYKALRNLSSKKPYFITSESAVTDETLNNILNLKNSLIAIDTEALNFTQLRKIFASSERITAAKSTIIIALNKHELVTAEKLDEASIIQLKSRFESEERSRVNKILDSVGTSRLGSQGTILDNIYTVANSAVITRLLGNQTTLKHRIDERVRFLGKAQISKPEFGLIYILAAKQKVLSVTYRAILERNGYTSTSEDFINTFEKHWSPFIEKTETDKNTFKATHSSFSLTSNSQAWVLYALQSISAAIGTKKSAELIVETVAATKENPNYYELIMFDVLNSLFSTTTSGANPNRALIGETYKKLAEILSSEPNYWLQRAKSIYHDHEANDISTVLAAIEHANKAITETEKTVTVNAKLTRANLYGLLCKLDNYNNTEYYIKAIDAYHEAIEDYSANAKYIDELIAKNKAGRGYLNKIINNTPNSDTEILRIREKISHLRNIIS